MTKLKKILEKKGKGLWANVHAKRKRGEKPAKKGDKDYPDEKAWKAAQKEGLEETVKEEDRDCFLEYLDGMYKATTEGTLEEAEYQGRKVALNKPMAGDVGKFKVYVKNAKGNVIKVNFGQKGVRIKKDNPEARSSFRARHKCDQKKDKTTAGYWSCKKW
tara:strand:- start:292 stop:771 length:480 start_codon:yes stop_codon:yes gene_type:complete